MSKRSIPQGWAPDGGARPGTPTGDVRAAVDEALIEAASETGAHIAVLYLLHETQPVLLMEAEVGMPAWAAEAWTRVRAEAGVPVAAALRRDELVWVPGRHDLTRRFPAAALSVPYAFAVAAAPVRAGARPAGSWLLMWPASHPVILAPDEIAAVDRTSRRLGELLAGAAERGRALQAVERPRVLTAPSSIATDAQQAPAALDCLDRFTEAIAAIDLEGHVTFCNSAATALLGLDGAPAGGHRLWEHVPWLRAPGFKDRCRAAVIGRQASSYVACPPDGPLMDIRLYPTASGISLFITPTGTGEHDRDEPAALGRVAAELPASNHARNFLHMASTLAQALDVREVADLVADHVAPVYGVRAMALLVSEGGRVHVVGSYGYTREMLDWFDGRPITSSTPAERVMQTGRPAYFSTLEELQRAYPEAMHHRDPGARAFLPLTVAERPIGTCVLAFTGPLRFTREERLTLTALAGLIAKALDRALLYEIKDELAQSLQTALLPATLPQVAGLRTAARYVPATRGVGVGGDFYDLLPLQDGSVTAVIGDVQGHNMTAAALMGQVRTAIRACAVTGAGPDHVLQHTNRLLIEQGADLFTSCLLIHVDLRLRTFRAASAGHPPPLLRLPQGHTEVIDIPAGPPLNIDPEAEYPALTVPFRPHAILTMYTDGLVEVPGADLDDRIAALARHLADAGAGPLWQLTDTLLDHAPQDRGHADDIALLLLQHEPPTAEAT